MYTPEIKFCVKYLLDHGINSLNFRNVASSLSVNDPRFEFVKTSSGPNDSFFEELASELRELWPPGNKNDKWPWRDSIPNLSKRLKVLWGERFVGSKFTISDCIAAASQYLSQFESDTKYMMTLKYFILKQEQIMKSPGHFVVLNKSMLADILEGKNDFAKIDNEWNDILNGDTIDQGELI